MKKGAKRGKEGVAKALNLTQHSTASMGQFDVKRIGELNKKKPDGARQKKPANDMTKAGIANESVSDGHAPARQPVRPPCQPQSLPTHPDSPRPTPTNSAPDA